MSLVNVTFFVYVVKVLASGSTTDSSTIQATLALVNYKKNKKNTAMMKDAVIKKIVNVQFIYSYTSGYFFQLFKTQIFFGHFLFLDLCKICLSN